MLFPATHRGAFCSFLSGGFTTMAVINPLERKLVKCNDLTNSKYQVRAMTGKGNFANIFEFDGKNSGNFIR